MDQKRKTDTGPVAGMGSGRVGILIGLLLVAMGCRGAAVPEIPAPGAIKLNQVGFYPGEPKLAIVPSTAEAQFDLIAADGDAVHFTGELAPAQEWPFSGEKVRIADFSGFDRPGRYRVVVRGVGESYPFTLGEQVHEPVVAAALKAFYYHRSGVELDPRHAGRWARPAGHVDLEARVHAAAASAGRPEGSIIASPGGWYDAGDYNKYIVNSSITVYVLLAAYEHYPEYFDRLEVNIPESGNGIPDLIDEVLWNLRWMLTMQDPDDGGVYHKLTTKGFSGMVMPHEVREPSYLMPKTTAAALDFAAVTAVASRVLRRWPELEPLALECRDAAIAAWDWARQHPQILYQQPGDVVTGTYAYEHDDLTDELVWAAAELAITTGRAEYLREVDLAAAPGGVPSWDYVGPLAWISLAHHGLHPEQARERIVATAERLRRQHETSAYRVAMGAYSERFLEGASEKDFSWGSNGVASYQGMMLVRAFELTGDRGYLEAALANLDYVLGRNAPGYCFVTGFGSRSPQHLHHRPSVADGIPEPIPGFVAGGPHDGMHDAAECEGHYMSDLPGLAYVDDVCSYATNEVAINWNASLVYVAGAIEYLVRGDG